MIAKNKKSSFVFIKLAMCSFSIFALAFLSSTTLFNHSAYAAFSISIGSNGTVDLGEITPSPSSGLVSSTATDNVSISTNCLSGYNIYATGTNGNSTDLVDTKHGSTISTSSNTITSPAALANNTWGLVAGSTATGSGSIPGLNSGTPESFSGLPAYTTDFSTITPIYTAAADTTSTIRNDNIPIYYGIKVNTDTTPGNYTSSVLYTAIMNGACLRYTLNFDGNGATENNLQDQTINFGESVDLANFSSTDKIARTGHKLIGWKIKIGDTTSETVYPTDTNMVLDDGISSEVTLVAEWQVNSHTVTINAGAPACSATVHPTATTGCKMADGRIWILGNNGNSITWNNMFTGATGANNHDATVNSGICPSGYSAPKITDFDTLIQAYGGTAYGSFRNGYAEFTGALYSVLGLSDDRYWSSTENSSGYAYFLYVYSSYSYSVDYYGKTSRGYVLCYKEDDSPIASVSGAGTYTVGDTVTISATAKPGYHFDSWTVNSGSISTPTGNPATFTMPDSDVTLTANGAINTHTVSITSGTGISSTTGAGTYSVGQTVNISATPSSGYNFSSWTVNSGGASLASTTSSSTSFTMPDANVTITANGVESTPTCSASVHPTASTGCKMADGKTWIYGNNGGGAAWTTMFNAGSGSYPREGTLKNSSYCPSGYSAPKKSDYDTLAASYSKGGGLYTALGLSSSSYYWNYWSSTEASSLDVYTLVVTSLSADTYVRYDNRSATLYLLCVK